MQTKCSNVKSFRNVLNTFNLSGIINEPTRINRQSKTAIDNAIANFKTHFDIDIINTAVSDHFLGQTISVKSTVHNL